MMGVVSFGGVISKSGRMWSGIRIMRLCVLECFRKTMEEINRLVLIIYSIDAIDILNLHFP